MNTGTIGFIVLATIACGGLAVFVLAMARNQRRTATGAFAVLVIGGVGLLFWAMFLSALQIGLAEAIMEGREAEQRYDVDVRFAAVRDLPKPEPSEEDVAAIRALKQAERTARQFGWSEQDLEAAYNRKYQRAGAPE